VTNKKTARTECFSLIAPKPPELSRSSQRKEKQLLDKSSEFFKQKRLSKITAEDVLRLRGCRSGSGVGPATTNMEVGVIRRMLNRAKRWHLIGADVHPLKEPRSIGRALTHHIGWGRGYDSVDRPRAGVLQAWGHHNHRQRLSSDLSEVYVGEVHPDVPRPAEELKGFVRVDLRAGQTQRVKVLLDSRAFSRFNTASHEWRVGPGDFTIFVGRSVDQIELKGTVSPSRSARH
jgi:hypothetical protein